MRVRLALNADCRTLPEIENDAGRLFAEIGMHDVADEAAPPAEAWEPYCESETLWVAEDNGGALIGFLASGQHDDILFIYQLAVAYAHQRRGIGRALMLTAEDKARALDLSAVYLTTFRDVAFNAPYYERQGYQLVEDANLPNPLVPVMAAERRRFSTPDRRRCAMIKLLKP